MSGLSSLLFVNEIFSVPVYLPHVFSLFLSALDEKSNTQICCLRRLRRMRSKQVRNLHPEKVSSLSHHQLTGNSRISSLS
jgi:hypothetical protein